MLTPIGSVWHALLTSNEKTVERHPENIFNKPGVRSWTLAVVFGVQYGLVSAQPRGPGKSR